MTEIFSHNVSFSADEETEGVYFVKGFDWEGNPFRVYLTEDDARNLIWQMSFYVSSQD